MTDELPRLSARSGNTHAIGDVIQTAFELLQKDVTSHALGARGLLKIIAELFFQREIDALGLLLFAQLQTVADDLGLAVFAMLSGREVALLDRAFLTETLCALEEQLHALTAAKTTYCTGITCHLLFSYSMSTGLRDWLRFIPVPENLFLVTGFSFKTWIPRLRSPDG